MKVFEEFDFHKDCSNGIVSLGSFDGVHLGHQEIIKKMKLISQNSNKKLPIIIMTFQNHPRNVISSEKTSLLTTKQEKIILFERFNVDCIYFINFTKEIANLDYIEFFNNYYLKLQPEYIIVGREHFFGKNRQGNISELRKLATQHNIKLIEVPEILIEGQKVSSSIIREKLLEGNIKEASKLLGYNYFVCGRIIKGLQVGKKIGYPTANIEVDKDKLLPSDGVYAARIKIQDNWHNGMLYIGKRPTFGTKKLSIEFHIFDFNENIYNQDIIIEVLEKTRDDITFNSVEELRKQIEQDEITIRLLFLKSYL